MLIGARQFGMGIETNLVESTESPDGMGEVATGVYVRRLPFSAEELKRA